MNKRKKVNAKMLHELGTERMYKIHAAFCPLEASQVLVTMLTCLAPDNLLAIANQETTDIVSDNSLPHEVIAIGAGRRWGLIIG